MYNIQGEPIATKKYKVGYKAKGYFCETQFIKLNLLPDIVEKFNKGKFSTGDYDYLKHEIMKATGIPTGNLGIDTIKLIC